MKVLSPQKVFVQYRGNMNPYGSIRDRKYTITHSDLTADLFVFVGENYAEDKVTAMRDEVRIAWEHKGGGMILMGSVLVDGEGVTGAPAIRNKIFYEEMPTALQALRQADRFLFTQYPELDKAMVVIRFISANPAYNKTYNFGQIGNYQYAG